MNRLNGFLLILLAVEIGAGIVWWWQRSNTVVLPAPDWSMIDPLAAKELEGLRTTCSSAPDWSRLGEALMAYGYFRESEACHRRAAALAPNDAEAAYQWAFALERLGLLEDADREYERANRLGHPLSKDCWYFVGRNHLRREQVDSAMASFEKAGTLPAARYERAKWLTRTGNREQALPLIEGLITEFPRAIQPNVLRFQLELVAGTPTGMEALADRATLTTGRLPNPFDRSFKQLTAAHDRYGTARVIQQCQQGVITDGLADRLREAQSRNWSPSGADLLAESCFQKRQFEEARRLLQEVLDRDGPSAHILIRLGDVAEAQGDRRTALDLWNRAILLGSPIDLKDLHARLREYHAQAGNAELARQHLAKAYYGAGMEEFWKNDLARAQEAFRLAVQEDGKHVGAWNYLGDTCRLLGQPEEARRAYQKALAADPDDMHAARSLRLLQ